MGYTHVLPLFSRMFPTKRREHYRWSLTSHISFQGDEQEEIRLALAAEQYEFFFTPSSRDRNLAIQSLERSIERSEPSAVNSALLSFMNQHRLTFPTKYEPRLFAHGTDNAESLCQILVEGKLHHRKGISFGLYGCYGELTRYDSVASQGGYHHSSWGVFVADGHTLERCFSPSQIQQKSVFIPLTEIKAILLPPHLARIARHEFPMYQHLIQSRSAFSTSLDAIREAYSE